MGGDIIANTPIHIQFYSVEGFQVIEQVPVAVTCSAILVHNRPTDSNSVADAAIRPLTSNHVAPESADLNPVETLFQSSNPISQGIKVSADLLYIGAHSGEFLSELIHQSTDGIEVLSGRQLA